MYGAREEDSPLPIDNESLSIVGHTRVNQPRIQPKSQPKRKDQLGNRASFHNFPPHRASFLWRCRQNKMQQQLRAKTVTMEVLSQLFVVHSFVKGTTTLFSSEALSKPIYKEMCIIYSLYCNCIQLLLALCEVRTPKATSKLMQL